MSYLARWIIAAAAVIFAAAMLAILALNEARAESKSATPITYADAVRSAAIKHRLRIAECRAVQAPPLCFAVANAEWTKALALAKASQAGTPEAWRAAEVEVRAADARVQAAKGQR